MDKTRLLFLLCATVLVFHGAAAAEAVRTIPECYTPGTPVTVSISANPGPNAACYTVTDTFPAGAAAAILNEGGNITSRGDVRWYFRDNTPRTLTYQVTIPQAATEPKVFSGRMAVDGVAANTGGSDNLPHCTTPPPTPGGCFGCSCQRTKTLDALLGDFLLVGASLLVLSGFSVAASFRRS